MYVNAAYLFVRGIFEQRWNIAGALLAGGELVNYSVDGLPEDTRDGEDEPRGSPTRSSSMGQTPSDSRSNVHPLLAIRRSSSVRRA
jgi:hypothetical protein